MLAALIVRRRTPAARRRRFEIDSVEVAVEREIEIEPALLAVGDHVESGGDLVADRGDRRVFLHLAHVVGPKLAQVERGKFQPAGKRVAADH